MRRPERRPINLNLPLRALYPYRPLRRRPMPIHIRRHPKIRQRDPMRLALVPPRRRRHRERQDHTRLLVRARRRELRDTGHHARRPPFRLRQRVVDGLEQPGQAIDPQIQQRAAREIHVRHAVRRAPYVFDVDAEGVVG